MSNHYHISHESHYPSGNPPSYPPPPGNYHPPSPPGNYPPPPPPGYQGYFYEGYPPPQPPHLLPHRRHDYYQDGLGCSSFLRGCFATLCCCCALEQCCF